MNESVKAPGSNERSNVRRIWNGRRWLIAITGVIAATGLLWSFRRFLPVDLVTLASAAITLISVGMAWRAMKESRRAMKESHDQLETLRTQSEGLRFQSEELRERMDTMHAAISTKYVASFPADMDSLINLLTSAQREISILIDVAGYGHMSRHALFKRYEQLLIRKKEEEKVDIHIAMYDMPSWDVITPRLFRPEKNDKELENDPDLRDYVRELKSKKPLEDYWSDLDRRLKIEESGLGVDERIHTFSDFIAQLRADELHYRKTVPWIDVFLSTKTHLPLLCWMVDGSHAVYSFIFDRSDEGIRESNSHVPSLPSSIVATDAYERYQDTNYEITFTTSDANLIAELKEVMWSYAPSLTIDQKTRATRSRDTDVVPRASKGSGLPKDDVPSLQP